MARLGKEARRWLKEFEEEKRQQKLRAAYSAKLERKFGRKRKKR